MIRKTTAILCAIGLVSCLTTQADGPAPSVPAPAWELQSLEGKSVKLSDFRGKVVLLNFWATWCPPCRAEIPDLISLQKQYAPQGLVVLGISMDEAEPGKIAGFAKRMEVNYPIVIGNAQTAEAYGGVEALPTTFVVDRAGHIVDSLEGATDRETLEEKIKALFK